MANSSPLRRPGPSPTTNADEAALRPHGAATPHPLSSVPPPPQFFQTLCRCALTSFLPKIPAFIQTSLSSGSHQFPLQATHLLSMASSVGKRQALGCKPSISSLVLLFWVSQHLSTGAPIPASKTDLPETSMARYSTTARWTPRANPSQAPPCRVLQLRPPLPSTCHSSLTKLILTVSEIPYTDQWSRKPLYFSRASLSPPLALTPECLSPSSIQSLPSLRPCSSPNFSKKMKNLPRPPQPQ